MTTNSTMDPRKFITGSNVIQIARVIENEDEKSLDTIKAMLHREKSRLTLNDLLRRSVLDPNQQIPKDTNSNMKVFKSMIPFGKIFVEKTTLYDICIENYINNRNEGHNEKAEDNIKVFKFLLEQRQPKKNFAELVVKLVDSHTHHPEASCELLKEIIQEKSIHKINLNQAVLVPTKLLNKLNDLDSQSQKDPQSSQERGSFSPLHKLIEVYNHSKQVQPPTNYQRVSLSEFLNLACKSKSMSKDMANIIKEMLPSQSVADPNLTQPDTLKQQL